jgi:hypothetical protein
MPRPFLAALFLFTLTATVLAGAALQPEIIGKVTTLDSPIVATGVASVTTEMHGATHTRVHLEDIDAESGAVVTVSAPGGRALQMRIEAGTRDVWLPAIAGGVSMIRVEPPSVRFRISEVATMRLRPNASSPFIDASCVDQSEFPAIERARHAVAQLTFIFLNGVAHCTGTLVADRSNSGAANLLTANHCIADQATASTVQAFFDDYTSSCGGAAPDVDDLPTVVGATLLASARASDASLLRLPALPPGRTFLRLEPSAGAAAPGTRVFRLSHPVSEAGVHPQTFTAATVQSAPPECVPPDHFVASSADRGATGPGSSGAALLLANGDVIGQILGSCDSQAGPEFSTTHAIDGLMSRSWSAFAPFLDAPAPHTTRRRSVAH